MSKLRIIDLGRMPYVEALDVQRVHLEEVLAAREAGAPQVGRLLLVEHEPVITLTRRAETGGHLLADADTLERAGVAVARTDRGGDITYHGPGQLVAYPILDLNVLGLRLVEYMRLLESVVIETVDQFGIAAHAEKGATGVWVDLDAHPDQPRAAKIAAMGVRVRRWVSMHGLALNVDPDLSHFDLIVPCGLPGRGVTSMRQLLGKGCPSMSGVKDALVASMSRAVANRVHESLSCR
ncbi:MAG: lipoyl(octanoyl) transferase LipB [Planctomycetes bacterium]|nr:lipoyl(octanoyl) transferase LipB [Planctomycetota bacterium]